MLSTRLVCLNLGPAWSQHKLKVTITIARNNIRNGSVPSPSAPCTAAMSDDLFGVSQQLRTPRVILNAIHGFVELSSWAVRGEDVGEEEIENTALSP